MELLESAMAFAVAMILFSTIATGIVEFLFRIMAVREKTLENALVALFDAVIWPRLRERLQGVAAARMAADNDPGETAGHGRTPPGVLGGWLAGLFNRLAMRRAAAGEAGANAPPAPDESDVAAKEALRLCFLRDMTGNPAVGGVFGDGKPSVLDAVVRAKRIDMLTTLAFAERLGKSEIGGAILAHGEEELRRLVNDFVRTYDRFGRASKEVYRKYANAMAIVVGIVLAFAANIDAGRLLNALVENPNLRTSLIADAESVAKANKAAVESLDEVLKAEKEGKLGSDTAEEIKGQYNDLIAQTNAAQARGLPVGWAYFPYCSPISPTDHKAHAIDRTCGESSGFWTRLRDHKTALVRWFVLTALAGFLIGLGGPFWFRVFSSLSQIAQMLRSIGVGARKMDQDGTASDEAAATTPAEDSAKPKDVIDAFRVAATVAHGGSVPAARAILGPDGRPV